MNNEPFKDLYASEKDLRIEDAARNAHKLKIWKIIAAAGATCSVMLGAALVWSSRSKNERRGLKEGGVI